MSSNIINELPLWIIDWKDTSVALAMYLFMTVVLKWFLEVQLPQYQLTTNVCVAVHDYD